MAENMGAGRARAELIQRAELWLKHCALSHDPAKPDPLNLIEPELVRDLLAGVGETVPQGYWQLRVDHARMQGDADGFQKGWHAALSRIRDGDAIEALAELVPSPTEAGEAGAAAQTAQLTKVRSYLCRLAKSVTRANSFQSLRRDREDGAIEYQIFADTDQPEDGCQIAWVQSTRHDAEFIAAVLAQAPLFEQLLLPAAPVLPAQEQEIRLSVQDEARESLLAPMRIKKLEAQLAALRAQLDPLVQYAQHKKTCATLQFWAGKIDVMDTAKCTCGLADTLVALGEKL